VPRRAPHRLTEDGVLDSLPRVDLGPCTVELREREPRLTSRAVPDALIAVRWGDRECVFVCEAKSRSAPRPLEEATAQAAHYAALSGLPPLVVVPFLGPESLARLECAGVSGIDLCGNAIILAPDFHIWRSGNSPQPGGSRPIREVFRGKSSLIARCLLLRPRFPSLLAVRAYALERMPSSRLSIGTVSKVVSVLEDELLVARGPDGLRVADGPALLRRLLDRYDPRPTASVEGRTDLPAAEVWSRLGTHAQRSPSFLYTATGLGSAARYGVLSASDSLQLHVSDLGAAQGLVELRETRLFPNVELIEDGTQVPYFDRRTDSGGVWASPVQTWLELMLTGPREREAAAELERRLLHEGGESL